MFKFIYLNSFIISINTFYIIIYKNNSVRTQKKYVFYFDLYYNSSSELREGHLNPFFYQKKI